MVKEQINQLQDAAIQMATDKIREQRQHEKIAKIWAICITILLVTALICASVFGCYCIQKHHDIIIEQQYALNMQYAELMEYIANAETTTETITNEADADNNGTAIAGNNNTVAGGD